MNAAGIVVVVLGIALLVIGMRGTQSQVFPWLFQPGSNESISTGQSAGSTLPGNINIQAPTNGSCPTGWILLNGVCYQIT